MAPSMHALPLVICNMGCEMMYILEQRLRAQSIKPDKAVKVLDDVSRAMFDASFVDELFRPQEMYTESSLKHVFTKLAHACFAADQCHSKMLSSSGSAVTQAQ